MQSLEAKRLFPTFCIGPWLWRPLDDLEGWSGEHRRVRIAQGCPCHCGPQLYVLSAPYCSPLVGRQPSRCRCPRRDRRKRSGRSWSRRPHRGSLGPTPDAPMAPDWTRIIGKSLAEIVEQSQLTKLPAVPYCSGWSTHIAEECHGTYLPRLVVPLHVSEIITLSMTTLFTSL